MSIFRWFKDDEDVTEQASAAVHNRHTFTLEGLGRDDMGVYKCEAKNKVSVQKRS